jgi:hypothetical protein
MAKTESKLSASLVAAKKSLNESKLDSPREANIHEQRFIESQNHCALCGSELKIKVESYLEDYYLREEAECPSCNIKTRVKNHKIQ